MKLPYSITAKAASVMINGIYKIVPSTAANFTALCAELRKTEHNENEIMRLADVMGFLALKKFADVEIGKREVRWKGKPVRQVIAERLIELVMANEDAEPLSLFLDKLMSNPVESAREELFLWLESGNAPICPDGDFLAFKRVRADFTDCHTGKFDNSPGKTVEMPFENCDTNRNNHCSRGLHFCQHGYLAKFSGSRTVIVKIHPADVVAIPTDYKFQKGRCKRYVVVGEVDNDEKKTADHFNKVIDDRYMGQVVRDAEKLKRISQIMTEVIVEQIGIEPSTINAGYRLSEEVNLDSLDGVEIVMGLESKLNIEIAEGLAEKLFECPFYEIVDGFYDYLVGTEELDCLDKKPDSEPASTGVNFDDANKDYADRLNDKITGSPFVDRLSEKTTGSTFDAKGSDRLVSLPKEEKSAPKKTKRATKEKTPKAPKDKGMTFTNAAGDVFSEKEVRAASELSHRKGAEKFGIGKTTFAAWLKKLNK